MDNVINFDRLDKDIGKLSKAFIEGRPFEHVIIDSFCHESRLMDAVENIPDVNRVGVNKSRDFIFAKNKFEKSKFDELNSSFSKLRNDLLSDRFSNFLLDLTGEKVFIDPEFHGGGLHQGGKGSFLDMHADFNYHPQNSSWFRNINILIYLNKGWKEEHRGELTLVDGRDDQGKEYRISPIFNRAVIMFTRGHTLHGYDAINFPEGCYRRSIAAYGYTVHEKFDSVRTTVWYPRDGGLFKKFVGKNMPILVKIKSAIFGSGTKNNK